MIERKDTKWTVYNPSTGEILRSGKSTTEEGALAQAREGEAILLDHSLDDAIYEIVNGEPALKSVDSAAELAEVKSSLLSIIDRQAGEIRSLFITASPGQEMVYAEKRAEAGRIIADPNLDPLTVPHLAAEATRENVTLSDKAAQVEALASQWVSVSALIEDKRLAAKAAVSAASTVSAAREAASLDWSTFEAMAGQ